MTYNTTIICLANSIKKQRRCIAGKISGTQHWLRPVTADQATEGAIEFNSILCTDGTYVSLLDIVEVPLSAHTPKKCQTENHLLAAGVWHKHGRAGWNDLAGLVDAVPDLWGVGHSSRYGENDKVPVEDAARLHDSLRLIKPDDLQIQVIEEEVWHENRTRKAIRGAFTHGGNRYRLKVTDPYFDYRNYEVDRPYHLPDAYVCVSLSDAVGGNHIKLIAGIITPQRAA